MSCPNLKTLAGSKYKVTYEESYQAQYSEHARREDPWLLILLCKNGHICPWSKNHLAACTSKAGAIAKRLAALHCVQVVQDGADGINAVFQVEHLAEVLKLMRPRRRRTMTAEQKQQAAERLSKYQFSASA